MESRHSLTTFLFLCLLQRYKPNFPALFSSGPTKLHLNRRFSFRPFSRLLFLPFPGSKQASKQVAGLKSPRTYTTEEALSRSRPQSSLTIQRLIWTLMSDIADAQGCPCLVHHCSTTAPSNSLFLSLLPPRPAMKFPASVLVSLLPSSH